MFSLVETSPSAAFTGPSDPKVLDSDGVPSFPHITAEADLNNACKTEECCPMINESTNCKSIDTLQCSQRERISVEVERNSCLPVKEKISELTPTYETKSHCCIESTDLPEDDNTERIIFLCDECNSVTESEEQALKHVEKHHTYNRYVCKVCDYEFENLCKLRAHAAEGCSKPVTPKGKMQTNANECSIRKDSVFNESEFPARILRLKVMKSVCKDTKGFRGLPLISYKEFSRSKDSSQYLVDTSWDPRAKIIDWPPFEVDSSNKWSCKICTKKGRGSIRHGIEHVRKHTTFRRFGCRYCEISSDICSRLKEHVKNKHGKEEVRLGEDYIQRKLPDHFFLNQETLRLLYNEITSSEGDSEDDSSGESASESKYNEYLINEQIKSGQIVRELPSPIVLDEGSFKCNYCMFTRSLKEKVITHQLYHVTWQPWRCSICSFKHVTEKVVRQHIKAAHVGHKNKLARARSCPKPRFYILNKTTCGILGLKPCTMSGLKIRKKKKSEILQKSGSKNVVHKAQQQDPLIISGSIKTIPHPVSIIGEIYSCNFCSKIGNLTTIDSHQLFHFTFRPFTCNVCGYATLVEDRLHAHMQLHSSRKEDYTIHPIPPEFHFTKATIKSLGNRIHQFRILGIEKCPRCSQELDGKDDMNNHLAYFHPECIQYKCGYCHEKMFTKNDYEAHHTEFHALIPFLFTIVRLPDISLTSGNPCSLCGLHIPKEFPIALHMADKHVESVEISCSLCGTVFKTRQKLRFHFTASHPDTEVAYTISLPGYRKRPLSPNLPKTPRQSQVAKKRMIDESKASKSVQKSESQKKSQFVTRGRPPKQKASSAQKPSKKTSEEKTVSTPEEASPITSNKVLVQNDKHQFIFKPLASINKGQITEVTTKNKTQHMHTEHDTQVETGPESPARSSKFNGTKTTGNEGAKDTAAIENFYDSDKVVDFPEAASPAPVDDASEDEEQDSVIEKDIEDKLSEYTECPTCCVSFKNEWNLFLHLKMKHPEAF